MAGTSGGVALYITRRTLRGGCHTTRSSISCMEENVGLQGSIQAHNIFDELLRMAHSGKSADSCLMGARTEADRSEADEPNYFRASNPWMASGFTLQRELASILETRVSAAYCSQSSKKRHMQAGESAPSPSETVPQCVKDCHHSFNLELCRDTYGTRTRPSRKTLLVREVRAMFGGL